MIILSILHRPGNFGGAVAEVLKTMCGVFREVFKKAPSEALLHDNYGRLCLVVDEMIYEVGPL